MDERRSKPRLSVNLDAVWNREQARQSARVTDLSEGGCHLDTVGDVMTGEIVAFRIMFPDGDWLYLEGEVRHHRQGLGFGVRFVDLNDDQMEKLRLLLNMAKDADFTAPFSADLVRE